MSELIQAIESKIESIKQKLNYKFTVDFNLDNEEIIPNIGQRGTFKFIIRPSIENVINTYEEQYEELSNDVLVIFLNKLNTLDEKLIILLDSFETKTSLDEALNDVLDIIRSDAY